MSTLYLLALRWERWLLNTLFKRDRALRLFPRALSEVTVDDSLFYVKQSLESQKR